MKAKEIEKKLYEEFDNVSQNIAINWYASGYNFISWDITPFNSLKLTINFMDKISSMCIDIANKLDFYCCPEAIFLDNKIRVSFFF